MKKYEKKVAAANGMKAHATSLANMFLRERDYEGFALADAAIEEAEELVRYLTDRHDQVERCR